MPMIDLTFVRGSLHDEALRTLADDLVTVLLRAEGVPDTAFMRDNTVVYLHAIDPAAQLVGGRQTGEPRFRVDVTAFGGAMSKEGKEQLAADVHAAVCVAADIAPDGSVRLPCVDADSRGARRELGGRRKNCRPPGRAGLDHEKP
jgi:phenylpyruvate tautomerase PptA (4-oxalocrotonate tautomerase family)